MNTAKAQIGLVWWNSCTSAERQNLMEAAEKILGHHASAADVWDLWQMGEDSLRVLAKINGVELMPIKRK